MLPTMEAARRAVCVLLFLLPSSMPQVFIANLPNKHYYIEGDLTLGAIIPVHQYSEDSFCSTSVRHLGLLQRLEALAFAVREINLRSDLLPRHRLGLAIFDDCYKDITALAQSLHFARTQPKDPCPGYMGEGNVSSPVPCENATTTLHYQIVGLIGSEASTTTVQVANMYTSFQLPQVSYLASAQKLSGQEAYPYFKRTVPPDLLQAKAIMQFFQHFNWTYVSLIYSQGDYGEGAWETLNEIASRYGVCFAATYRITPKYKIYDYNNMILTLLLETNARVVLTFISYEESQNIMAASERMRVGGRLTWIAGDAWARHINEITGYEQVLQGAFSVNVQSTTVQRFENYMENLSPSVQSGNPWLAEFWETYFDCEPPGPTPSPRMSICADNLRFTQHSKYQADETVSLVFDTVYTYARAIHQLVDGPCRGMRNLATCVESRMEPTLRNTSFSGEGGRWIDFNDDGDIGTSAFTFNNIQASPPGYKFVHTATWESTDSKLKFTGEPIQWTPKETTPPASVCSRECGKGQQQVLQQKRCCWACEDCLPNQYTKPWFGLTRCYDCRNNTWPDPETRLTCQPIVPKYLKWEDPLGIVLTSLASTGIAICLLVAVLNVCNINHPLIKASSRELSFLLLFGILVSYCFVFCFLMAPSDAVCLARLVGFSCVFTLMYAPLVTKTIRIFRIFDAGQKFNRNPSCVSSASQMALAMNIIFVHMCIIVGWSIGVSPEVRNVQTGDKVEVYCQFHNAPFITSIAVNGVLLIAAAFCAFKNRKLPNNYNESKWIVFCVYSTVVIMLAFVPAYFTVSTSLFKSMFLSLMMIITATVMLVSLFLPKLYAVYFVDYSNMHLTAGGRKMGLTKRLPESPTNVATVAFPLEALAVRNQTATRKIVHESSRVAPSTVTDITVTTVVEASTRSNSVSNGTP